MSRRQSRPPISRVAQSPRRQKKIEFGVDELTRQRAWRAVQRFNAMIPAFTRFAQRMTGNPKVSVRVGKRGAATDGTTIWLAPPIGLGDSSVHETYLCDTRGPDLRNLCGACDARESALWPLYHEIAHISKNSAVAPSSESIKKMRTILSELHPREVCNHLDQKMREANAARDSLNLIGIAGEYLPMILKALEDARVDSAMLENMPGLRPMFRARIKRIFEQGYEELDGSISRWRDAPLLSQLIIGVLLVASGYEIHPHYLLNEARVIMKDRKLISLALRAPNLSDVHETFDLTLEVWQRFQELGFFKEEVCRDPFPNLGNESEEQSNESSNNDGSSQSGDSSSGSGNPPDGGSGQSQNKSESSPSSESGKSNKGQFENDDSSSNGSDSKEGTSDDNPNEGGVSNLDSNPTTGDNSDEDGRDSLADGDSASPESNPEQRQGDDAGKSGKENDHPSEESSSEDSKESNGSGSGDNQSGEENLNGESDSGSSPESEDTDAAEESTAEQSNEDSSSGFDRTSDTESSMEEESGHDSDDGDASDYGQEVEVKGASVWNDEPIDSVAKNFAGRLGNPQELKEALAAFTGHGDREVSPVINEGDAETGEGPIELPFNAKQIHNHLEDEETDESAKKAIAMAATQSEVFDTSSRSVHGLAVYRYPVPALRWDGRTSHFMTPENFMPTETILGSNLMPARVAFANNRRANHLSNLKSGTVKAGVLGRRAATGDPRLFHKRVLPGRRDYFVVIGIDCSGSNNFNGRMEKSKRTAFGMAELLSRLGVKFAIYGHSGGRDIEDFYARVDMEQVWMLEIKAPEEPWGSETRKRLARLQPAAENFDGHTMEFYRKILDQRTETDKIIMYFTDGDMPAANYDEELAVLQSELATCKRKNYTVVGVGIQTDSPTGHGLPTVRVDRDEDIALVVKFLRNKLTEK